VGEEGGAAAMEGDMGRGHSGEAVCGGGAFSDAEGGTTVRSDFFGGMLTIANLIGPHAQNARCPEETDARVISFPYEKSKIPYV